MTDLRRRTDRRPSGRNRSDHRAALAVARAIALAAPALAAAGCATLPPPPAGLAAPVPVFSPERFFAGRTQGRGTLRIVAHHARAVRVTGVGRVEPDGTLVLEQSVVEGDAPPRTRAWRIRRVAPGRYAGTLSDAAGPVAGEVTGNRLRLRFHMKGGLAVEQRLYLRPDGRTALNRMTVSKFGVVVATLAETITKE